LHLKPESQQKMTIWNSPISATTGNCTRGLV
jgi:hypothetical protein